MLNIVEHGTATDLPQVLIAHGLFGSARNWGAIAKRLSADRKVIAVDMRNHGESFWTDTHTYVDMAEDLSELLDVSTDLVGHSMGGKAAMMLALHLPRYVRRLVVADIAPVAYSHTQMPMIEAMRSVDLSQVETRRDADEQLALRVEEPGVRAFLLQSLDVAGKRWRLNLDTLAADMMAILGFPETNAAFEGATLFLSGGESDYVRDNYRADIKAKFPVARFARIPGAGHWLHAEKPREFEDTVRLFLDT
ncbi:MAG: alpha/beta fold hydrolase [Silicimonas sp.]|nr:alpha/beta fold hydrolase [Silicimonas sp.]